VFITVAANIWPVENTPAVTWSAQEYVTFEDERTRPVRDLVAAIRRESAREVIDLGCGPGNSTGVLAARFPGASISGVDNSADMIAAARLRLPAVNFATTDIEDWVAQESVKREDLRGRRLDVILANAVLQWMPDHSTLLPALVATLAQQGVLAIQMPDNLEEPAHCLMREVAAAGPWAARLAMAAAARAVVPDVRWYYELLSSAGCQVDVWRTTYFHPLTGGATDVVEWFKGTGLRPFLAPLDAVQRTEFLTRYQHALGAAYPAMPDGGVLLPFPRLFIVAVRR
jgi:trans-aconitate 2-methyltransferase